MTINFNTLPPQTLPGMHGGTGEMTAILHEDEMRKIIPCRIHAGGSIGMHAHEDSDEINYVLYGTGIATCNGVEEPLFTDVCHICPKGASHSITNTGESDLVLLTVITKR